MTIETIIGRDVPDREPGDTPSRAQAGAGPPAQATAVLGRALQAFFLMSLPVEGTEFLLKVPA
jgi:hypothetical protein